MKGLTIAAIVLMVIGAINWGLIGLFGANANLVTLLFGTTILSTLVYLAVGLAGVYGIFMFSRLVAKSDDVCVPGDPSTRRHVHQQ